MTGSATARTAGLLTALATITIVAQRTRLPAELVVPAGVAALVFGSRASGLGWDEMGMGHEALVEGLPAAAVAATLTASGVAAAAVHPRTPDLRDPVRYPTPAVAWRAALGTIPLSVAVPEEFAFRGVLDASLRRHVSPASADAVGALAFGVWHVLGARSLGPGRRGRVLGVAGTVVSTAAAGLVFATVRRRTGSVLPGIAAHWALNGSAAVAAARARPGRSAG